MLSSIAFPLNFLCGSFLYSFQKDARAPHWEQISLPPQKEGERRSRQKQQQTGNSTQVHEEHLSCHLLLGKAAFSQPTSRFNCAPDDPNCCLRPLVSPVYLDSPHHCLFPSHHALHRGLYLERGDLRLSGALEASNCSAQQARTSVPFEPMFIQGFNRLTLYFYSRCLDQTQEGGCMVRYPTRVRQLSPPPPRGARACEISRSQHFIQSFKHHVPLTSGPHLLRTFSLPNDDHPKCVMCNWDCKGGPPPNEGGTQSSILRSR